MELDYILSGCSFARMMNKRPTFKNIVASELKKFNADNKGNYKLSLLFNALTESGHGDVFMDYRKEADIYIDSGGLQLGLYGEEKYGDIEQRKKEVYETQGTYGDYAFVFEDIPIEEGNKDGNSSKVNLSMRYFTPDRVKEAAENTAKNVKAQIETFKRLQSDTKIFLIAHGNCPSTYADYIERVVDNLTQDEIDYVFGVAPSGAANGAGAIERFDMIYGVKGYNIPDHIKKHVHLLGVGAPKALLPFAITKNYFSFIDRLSFDSTTHSRKYAFSGEIRTYDKEKFVLPKNRSIAEAVQWYQRIWDKYAHHFQSVDIMTIEEMIEGCTHYSTANVKNQWEFGKDEDKYKVGQSLLPALTSFDFIEQFFEDVEKLYARYSKLGHLNTQINTLEDYMHYRKDIIHLLKLKSNKVSKRVEKPTVDDWF
jgi:hypothetical protein